MKDVTIEQMLHRLYAADFNEHCSLRKGEALTEMSVEYQNFLKLMGEECSKEGKLCKLSLPLRVLNKFFPNNRKMAEAGLKNLKKRFVRDK